MVQIGFQKGSLNRRLTSWSRQRSTLTLWNVYSRPVYISVRFVLHHYQDNWLSSHQAPSSSIAALLETLYQLMARVTQKNTWFSQEVSTGLEFIQPRTICLLPLQSGCWRDGKSTIRINYQKQLLNNNRTLDHTYTAISWWCIITKMECKWKIKSLIVI